MKLNQSYKNCKINNEITKFVKDVGLENSIITKLNNDCSNRVYYRVNHGDKKYLIMDSSAELESFKSFIKLTSILKNMNMNAPQIYEQSNSNGIALIEDFGDISMKKYLLTNPQLKYETYVKALDALRPLQEAVSTTIEIDDYGTPYLYKELAVFIDWYLEDKSIAEDLIAEFATLYSIIQNDNNVLVLRDYHAENIMILDDGSLGLIDYQDALIGNISYDIMSLLEDARIYIDVQFEEQCLQYINNYIKYENFTFAYKLLGIQRNLKILGVFNRKSKRDGDPFYLSYFPYVKKYLNKDLQDPRFARLKEIIGTFDEE